MGFTAESHSGGFAACPSGGSVEYPQPPTAVSSEANGEDEVQLAVAPWQEVRSEAREVIRNSEHDPHRHQRPPQHFVAGGSEPHSGKRRGIASRSRDLRSCAGTAMAPGRLGRLLRLAPTRLRGHTYAPGYAPGPTGESVAGAPGLTRSQPRVRRQTLRLQSPNHADGLPQRDTQSFRRAAAGYTRKSPRCRQDHSSHNRRRGDEACSCVPQRSILLVCSRNTVGSSDACATRQAVVYRDLAAGQVPRRSAGRPHALGRFV